MAFGEDEDYSGKPVEEGETYEVDIEDLGSKGDGIARVDNFVVFVPETEVGERVEVEINSVGRKFAFGDVVERLGEAEGDVAAEADEAPEEAAETEEAEDAFEEDVEEDAEEEPAAEEPEEPEDDDLETEERATGEPEEDDESLEGPVEEEAEEAPVEEEPEELEDAPGSIEDQF